MPVASLDEHANRDVPAPFEAAAQLVEESFYLRRFLGDVRLLVVRTFQITSGDRFVRVTYEPWLGL